MSACPQRVCIIHKRAVVVCWYCSDQRAAAHRLTVSCSRLPYAPSRFSLPGRRVAPRRAAPCRAASLYWLHHPAGGRCASPVSPVWELFQAAREVRRCSRKFGHPFARASCCWCPNFALRFELCECCARSVRGDGGGDLVERVICDLHCMCKGCGSDRHGVAAGQGQGPSEGHQVLGKGCGWRTSHEDGCPRTAGKACSCSQTARA
jgi:hypothetical protein